MNTREVLEGEVRASLQLHPGCAQLLDRNFRMRGFRSLLSVWQPDAQAGAASLADLFERHIQRRYRTEQTAGRLLVGPWVFESQALDLAEGPDVFTGVALWLEPEQQTAGLPDLHLQLARVVDPHVDERIAHDAVRTRSWLTGAN